MQKSLLQETVVDLVAIIALSLHDRIAVFELLLLLFTEITQSSRAYD